MEKQSKQSVTFFTKISLGANIALFGITGLIYLIDVEKYDLIGYLLLAAGLTNVIWMLFSIPTKNLFFAILNFLFTGVALFVGFHYQFKLEGTTMATIWFAIALFYLINGFIILLRLKKEDKEEKETPSET